MNDMTVPRHLRRYLLIVAICAISFATSGCVQSIWELTSDSRLPKWIALPPGLTRADVHIEEETMEPTRRGVDIKVTLYDKKWRRLEEVRGKTFYLSGRYFVDVVDGVPEVTGLKMQKNEHGIGLSYFFVVDDLALKEELLDANERKLLQDCGTDYSTLRRMLLGQKGPHITDRL